MPRKKKNPVRKSTPKSRVRAVNKTSKPASKSRVRTVVPANDSSIQGGARTIIYVHGIANKPPADVLKCQWDHALFGFDLGDRSRLAYWVDRVRYPQPSPGTCHNADSNQLPSSESGFGVRSIGPESETPESLVPPEATGEAKRALERMARETIVAGDVSDASIRTRAYGARVLPLPGFLRNFFTRQITKLFLKDVNDFLFDKVRREFMRRSVIERLESGGGPFVVIGHSQGSMIAYDVLRSLPADKFAIDLFVTIGSPLGLTEVKDQLKKFDGRQPLAVPACVKRWVNVADPIDPVCADKTLVKDYRATSGVAVEDVLRWNLDSPTDPHSGSGYLRLEDVRQPVRAAVQRDLFQRIAPFALARDVVKMMENGRHEDRHPVLIELQEEPVDGRAPAPLEEVRKRVVAWIEDNSGSADSRELEIEALKQYVSANLTRFEIERIADELHLQAIYRIFHNSRKRALLTQSAAAVHAPTAHAGYGARGQGIVWATLDSGVDPDHPHFAVHGNIHKVYDCLTAGPVRERNPKKTPVLGKDVHGHGTHVCGIIAGANPALGLTAVAPMTRLISYKVLDDSGGGSDAKIIKALDHIFDTNAEASDLVIHGVNLSLGGPFNPEVFGCGDSPLCKQLRKLWRQGVVVVLAAGNEGYLELQQGSESVSLNLDLSIGDPANLDECLAVGSVHKTKPHFYGVSYFSSRGPTADGRGKPDLVAPGEKILSCRAGGRDRGNPLRDLYVAMSGTSMAAPHVSGVVASFLSVRREFIGYPDRVKEHLLANCTDLKRDRMHQGSGIPNIVKMLLNS
jgi:subtilisin family serine protease